MFYLLTDIRISRANKNKVEQAGAELGQAQPQLGLEVRIGACGLRLEIEVAELIVV